MNFLQTLILIGLICCTAGAQTTKRHPRVLEVEKGLNTEVQIAVRDLLPGQPFYLNVTIDPIHRQSSSVNSKEALPYFESNEEIKDEWDDPNRSDFELLNRVNRISVKATVSASLNKEQINDLKSAIIGKIPYVDRRDLVEIEQKEWPQVKDRAEYTTWILTIGLVLMMLLGLLYFLVSSVSVSRLTKAIKNIKISNSESAGNSMMGQIGQTPQAAQNNATNSQFGSGGQVQISDSLRMTEVIVGLIKNFENSKAFPTLEDMLLIDQSFKIHPASTGALIAEFPQAVREHLFSLSYANSWLEGLTNPGEINFVSFELMNRLTRVQRHSNLSHWNHFLVLCWRLDKRLPQFLKSVESSDRLAILRSLPQSIAIEAAREIMPGEWAAILRKVPVQEILSEEKVNKYKKMALDMLPLRSSSSLDQFKKDADLIKYLKTVDPIIEKEIYGAASAHSDLVSLRPPFFPVLEMEKEEFAKFNTFVTVEEWSLALMNVPRNVRAKLESSMSDKQKFRLIELIKRNDKSNVSHDAIGEARERIGNLYKDFIREKNAQNTAVDKTTDGASAPKNEAA